MPPEPRVPPTPLLRRSAPWSRGRDHQHREPNSGRFIKVIVASCPSEPAPPPTVAGLSRRHSRRGNDSEGSDNCFSTTDSPRASDDGVTRRTTEETHQLLLDVALGMLHRRGVHVAVTHVRLSDVAAAAGLTTGAAYRCWPNQAAFHRDLAVAAVQWRDHESIAETVAEIRDLVDAQARSSPRS